MKANCLLMALLLIYSGDAKRRDAHRLSLNVRVPVSSSSVSCCMDKLPAETFPDAACFCQYNIYEETICGKVVPYENTINAYAHLPLVNEDI